MNEHQIKIGKYKLTLEYGINKDGATKEYHLLPSIIIAHDKYTWITALTLQISWICWFIAIELEILTETLRRP